MLIIHVVLSDIRNGHVDLTYYFHSYSCVVEREFGHLTPLSVYSSRLPGMAIPSSPPLPAREDVNPASHDIRKRQYADYDSLSSDPIFSEDASDSDERTGHKRKRLFKGPWWVNTTFAPRHGQKSTAPKDSGVWLASEDSVDSGQSENEYRYTRGSSPPLPEEDASCPVNDCSPIFLAPAEDLASRWIMRCVEEDRQTIDLT